MCATPAGDVHHTFPGVSLAEYRRLAAFEIPGWGCRAGLL